METRSKGLKIGIALVLMAVAVGIWYWNRPQRQFPSEWTFVCVATGKVFSIPNEGRVREFPLENPETRERTLLPCSKHEDGSYYISSRWRDAVRQLGDANKTVDPETLKVNDPKP